MKQRGALIVGNWKMNGSLAENATLLSELRNAQLHSDISQLGNTNGAQCKVAVCVPFLYLAQTQSALQTSPIAWGAQDVSGYVAGAYTGEVSASMLNDFACGFGIVGHSERRTYHAESDALVAQKTLRLLEVGITPIVCVGETLQERNDGITEATVARQLNAVLSVLDKSALSKIVIAYEPVWAIGTGVTATPEMAQQVHAFLRAQLALANQDLAEQISLLYGGSMKPDNAAALLSMKDIDGGLIGGASLKAIDFLSIITATRNS